MLLDYLSVRLASTLSGDPGVLQSYYRFSRHLSTLFADDVEVDQLDVDGNLLRSGACRDIDLHDARRHLGRGTDR